LWWPVAGLVSRRCNGFLGDGVRSRAMSRTILRFGPKRP
jgi:hypothetical protein